MDKNEETKYHHFIRVSMDKNEEKKYDQFMTRTRNVHYVPKSANKTRHAYVVHANTCVYFLPGVKQQMSYWAGPTFTAPSPLYRPIHSAECVSL